jgi:hypothetical protein
MAGSGPELDWTSRWKDETMVKDETTVYQAVYDQVGGLISERVAPDTKYWKR